MSRKLETGGEGDLTDQREPIEPEGEPEADAAPGPPPPLPPAEELPDRP